MHERSDRKAPPFVLPYGILPFLIRASCGKQRQQIWKIHTQHPGIPVAEGIDWEKISLKYELSGGFIKNAVMSALLLAIAR